MAFELAQRGLVHHLELVQQAQLDHAARLEGLARFVLRWLDHIPAAPGADGDDATRGSGTPPPPPTSTAGGPRGRRPVGRCPSVPPTPAGPASSTSHTSNST